MSTGLTHILTYVSMALGTTLGYVLAKKFKSWYIFYFVLAIAIGWFIHVVIYDQYKTALDYLLRLSWQEQLTKYL